MFWPLIQWPAGLARKATVSAMSSGSLARFRAEILPGLRIADAEALARIRSNWTLSNGPESDVPFDRPSLIVCGRQDDAVGYVDQFALLPHYPRASFAVLDVAEHNLQFEQPELFETLVGDWLDRVADQEGGA